MFEKEIQFITDFNLNKIKRLGSFFTLDDLTKAKVHPAIVQYISAEIDYLIFLDRQNLLQKSVFDYSGPEIVEHFLAISQEIKKNKLLPYEEVKKIIQQAVTFQLTYLLRPVWTLKKFVFDSSEIRSQEEVKLFLNYLYFFDYYKKIFLTILEKKKLLTISIFEFESLLEKIQRQLLDQQMKNVIENALMDAAEFINTGEVTKTKLAIETLEIFLKDKGLHNHIFKVRKLLSVDPKQKFELSEIFSAIFSPVSFDDEEAVVAEDKPDGVPTDESQLDIFQSAEEALHEEEKLADELLKTTQEPEIEEEEISETINSLTDEVETPELQTENYEEEILPVEDEDVIDEKTDLVEEESFVNEEEIPEDEEFASEEIENEESLSEETFLNEEQIADDKFEENDELESAVEKFSIESTESETENGEISFEKYFKEELEKNEAKLDENSFLESEEEKQSQPLFEDAISEKEDKPKEPEVDIFSYFTTKETMKIISAIFNQDSLDFVNTLERIAECSNEDEAGQILKDVFLSYRVNSVGKEAALLKEKVEQFFRDKEF
ncbi:MAG: hypothetical protein WC209_18260 [Ignavibacteriaceae bacterium]|jgi:hypothetical protein